MKTKTRNLSSLRTISRISKPKRNSPGHSERKPPRTIVEGGKTDRRKRSNSRNTHKQRRSPSRDKAKSDFKSDEKKSN